MVDEQFKITDAPEVIWLNYGELEKTESHRDAMNCGEVLWCEDQVDSGDVKYIRADIILAERKAMLAKLEAAQRLRDVIRARKVLATRIKESGPAPHSDYWGQSVHEADQAVEAALAAFDKEQTE